MLFPTVQFALFFPLVLALSWALMPRQALWKLFIVLASYVFYAAANWRFCLLLGGVTLGNQAGAQLIGRSGDERRRKQILAATVALDLGVLARLQVLRLLRRQTPARRSTRSASACRCRC